VLTLYVPIGRNSKPKHTKPCIDMYQFCRLICGAPLRRIKAGTRTPAELNVEVEDHRCPETPAQIPWISIYKAGPTSPRWQPQRQRRNRYTSIELLRIVSALLPSPHLISASSDPNKSRSWGFTRNLRAMLRRKALQHFYQLDFLRAYS
jgi:hypothetical protein